MWPALIPQTRVESACHSLEFCGVFFPALILKVHVTHVMCVCVRVFFGGGRRINLQPQALKFGRIGKSLHLSSGSHPEACLVQLMNGQWHADSVRHATNMQMNIFVVIELIAADC